MVYQSRLTSIAVIGAMIFVAFAAQGCGSTPKPTPAPTPRPTPAPTSKPTPAPTPKPTPKPQLALVSTAVATNPTHYGNPTGGCESDEQAVRVQGLTGDFCSPSCSSAGVCPSDLPKQVTATPSCILQSPTGTKNCALKCTPSAESDNGAANECGAAHCQSIQGIGICTYDAANTTSEATTVAVQEDVAEEYVKSGVLKITWTDCGDAGTHAKITSLKPDTLKLGDTTTLTGSGNLDEKVDDGSFEMDIAAGIIKQTFKGDACEKKSFKLPLGMGSLSWNGLKCPVALGATDVSLDVLLSALLPAKLASATISLTATSKTGDKLVCMQVKTAPAAEEIIV